MGKLSDRFRNACDLERKVKGVPEKMEFYAKSPQRNRETGRRVFCSNVDELKIGKNGCRFGILV